jgi:hypothetical protein
MTDTPQTFTLTSPTGEVIMTGSMSAIMERLPDTRARDDALDSMLHTAIDAVEAEEKRQDAVRSCAQMLDAFADQMNARIDAYEAKCEAEAEEAKALAEQQEAERIAAIAEELAPIIPPEGEQPLAAQDDGDLEIKHKVDPERCGEDAEGTGPVPLSYGTKPALSYVKSEAEDPGRHDPLPFDPDAPGAVRDPEPGPEPGSRLYQGPPQHPQPTSVSLNED